MQELQLYIQGQRIDLFKDESVSITQSIQNVKDIAKVFTDFSKTFSIPASKTNNRIFKHYYNFDIVNGFDARVKVDATIELNNLPFKNGKIKLDGVDLKNNVPHTYKITFFGSTVTLKDVLGEKKLQSLGNLDNENLIYNVTNVKSKLQADPTTTDVIAPLITHTQRLFYDSTTGHAHDDNHTGNLYYEQGSGHEHGIEYDQLKYAIRVHRIIEAIQVDNPSISFSDDFFNTTNAPYYNLFMWLHRKKGDVQNLGGVNQSLVNGFTAGSYDQNTETFMLSSSTLSVSGVPSYYQVFNLYVSPNTASLSIPYKVAIYKNGVENYRTELTSGNILIDKFDFDVEQATYDIYIEGESNMVFTSIYWEIYYREPFGTLYDIQYPTSSPYVFNSSFEFSITQQIPEMKIIDFLTGLFKMFNLTAYVEDDFIQVKTLDSFYDSGTQYDISKYVDVNKSSVNVALPYREISFLAEDTNTLLAKQHEQLAGKTWGKLSYNGGVDEIAGELYNVKSPFSQLKYEHLIDVNTGAVNKNTDIQWGYFVDDNQESYYGKPLLFYPIRQTSATQISFVESASSHVALTTYNIPSNSVYLNPATGTDNINFNNEINEYTNTNDFEDTLYKKYYENYILSVFNEKNRITKLTAYLPLRILLNLKLEDRFIINGNSYKINTITTNLQTGKSELELLNDL